MQVSISGQALVFVVRTQRWSFRDRAGGWLYLAFGVAQVTPSLLGSARVFRLLCGEQRPALPLEVELKLHDGWSLPADSHYCRAAMPLQKVVGPRTVSNAGSGACCRACPGSIRA